MPAAETASPEAVLQALRRELTQALGQQAEVAAGHFRADLYDRLNVFPIALPPLLEHVARRQARRLGGDAPGPAPAFVAAAVA